MTQSIAIPTLSEIEAAVERVLERHPMTAPPEVLTRAQTAELLQVDPQVVARWVGTKGLPGFKVGQEWRFFRADVIEWLRKQKVVAND